MSLEFIDGFDHYQTASLLRKWSSGSITGAGMVAGRFGGQAVQMFNNDTGGIVLSLSALATRIVGFAFKADNPGNALPIIRFLDGATTQSDIRLTTGRLLTVTRNGTVLQTSASALTLNQWYFIEIRVTIDNAGSWEVRVDGSASGWLSGSGDTQNTANASTNGIRISCDNSHSNFYDDLYVLNTSGSAPTNTFLGGCRVITSMPSADSGSAGSNSLWTPDSGSTHYTQADDPAVQDDDTTYVSSGTAAQIDTYQYPDISPAGTVIAVQTVICDRKNDAGARSICAEYRSGAGTNYDGASTFTPTSSYLMHRQIYETDPATSAAWTAANINAGEFGVKCLA